MFLRKTLETSPMMGRLMLVPERIVSFGGMFSQLGDSLYGIEAVRDRP